MRRGFHFGNHSDAARVCILQQVDHLAAGVEAICALAQVVGVAIAVVNGNDKFVFGECASASRSHFGEFGQSRDFQSPCFVVGKVEVQRVEFVVSQQINHSLHIFERGEIAGNIKH